MDEADKVFEVAEEVANAMRGYLLMGERVAPDDAAFGFGEAKRIMRESVKKLDDATDGVSG